VAASPSIPVIDIQPLVEGSPRSDGVVDEIRVACETIGFFVVTGHAVPESLIERIRERSRAFFDLPSEAKARTPRSGSILGGVTYTPVAGEALAASRGVATPGDLKQSLDYGPLWPGGPWPEEPAGLRAAWEDYYAAMSGLSGHLRRAFARAIGLAETWFEDRFDNHLSSLRAIDYPESTSAPAPGQMRAGAHSDYGFLTILLSEASAGGLEVQPLGGDWVPVPNVDGSFVINIGDAMQRWTNDAWVSTLHRVANASADRTGARRQSIPFFHNPNPDGVIAVLDSFVTPERPARYEPTTYRDYALQKAAITHAVR
jgi:isopenicillin N synthase-like dioxygenase